MFKFLDHIYEIFTVAKKLNDDIGVAFDKFRTDVEQGHALAYNTGDSLPNFNFKTAKEDWDSMTKDEQADAYNEYFEFNRTEYAGACAAFAKDEDAMKALVSQWRAK